MYHQRGVIHTHRLSLLAFSLQTNIIVIVTNPEETQRVERHIAA